MDGRTASIIFAAIISCSSSKKNVTITMINVVGMCGCEVGPADLLQGKNIDYKLRFKAVVALL